MPHTDQFLYHNDPTSGLPHEDDRGILELCQRRRLEPRSSRGPWLGQVNPYAHERTWTEGWWAPRNTPNSGPTWGVNPYDHPVDHFDWDPFRNKPIRPYWILQPLEIANLYFVASILEQPS